MQAINDFLSEFLTGPLISDEECANIRERFRSRRAEMLRRHQRELQSLRDEEDRFESEVEVERAMAQAISQVQEAKRQYLQVLPSGMLYWYVHTCSKKEPF